MLRQLRQRVVLRRSDDRRSIDGLGVAAMTEHEHLERPWTPGPWKWRTPTEYVTPIGSDGTIVITGTLPFTATDADKDLIALAPEMAEAILTFAEDTSLPSPDPTPFLRLAEKLRGIGNA